VTGIGELVTALDAHRDGLDVGASRTRARRLGALADYVAEHGERGLRGLGGRRAAVRWLEEQDASLSEAVLVQALEAQGSRQR
jgi:LAO/AO transport system kinase